MGTRGPITPAAGPKGAIAKKNAPPASSAKGRMQRLLQMAQDFLIFTVPPLVTALSQASVSCKVLRPSR